MKIVIAPDSFKESLPASEVAKAIKRGLQKALPESECLLLPVGDGGEGTVDAIKSALGLEEHTTQVTGPFGDEVQMPYVYKETLALFEVADLIGLAKIPIEKRNPLKIQTKGIGQLILHLIEQGMKEIYIGVGGTSSNDGGIGIASGIGYHFYDKNGDELLATGQYLFEITDISKEKVISIPSDVRIKILADVTNPLCGLQGATYTFGKQKGLNPAQFHEVDSAIENFYRKVAPEILKLEGAGAGGGIAAGLCAFAGATITPDGVPVIAICGSLSEDLPPLPFENIVAAFSILEKSEPLEESLKKVTVYLENTAANIGQILALKKH